MRDYIDLMNSSFLSEEEIDALADECCPDMDLDEGFLGLPTSKKCVVTLLVHGFDTKAVAKTCHCKEEEVLKIAKEVQRKGQWPTTVPVNEDEDEECDPDKDDADEFLFGVGEDEK